MPYLFILLLLPNLLFSLTLYETKHLLNRVHFSYNTDDIKKFLPLSKQESVTLLLKEAKNKDTYPFPLNIKEISLNKNNSKKLTFEQRKEIRIIRKEKMKEISIWWNKMMLDSKFSFRERMVLFWHSLLTSEYKVVKNPYMMYKQNSLYRSEAVGNFENLINKSSKDLAMLVYLDNNSNIKDAPNENYARELMELFTLGEGNYEEKDIKEAARAFTGWKVRKRTLGFKKIKKYHDNEFKTFLNKTGNFDGEDIIRIILEKDRASEYLVSRLYETFISNNINLSLVKTISKKFKSSNYEISVALNELFLSDDFWNKDNLLIKSPVEYTIGAIKQLELKPTFKEFEYLLKIQKKLGQELFNPPSVKGWEEGKNWIDSSSLIYRQKFIKRLVYKKINNIKKKSYLKNFDTLNMYFFNVDLKEDIKFVKNKKILINYLIKLEYQVK